MKGREWAVIVETTQKGLVPYPIWKELLYLLGISDHYFPLNNKSLLYRLEDGCMPCRVRLCQVLVLSWRVRYHFSDTSPAILSYLRGRC